MVVWKPDKLYFTCCFVFFLYVDFAVQHQMYYDDELYVDGLWGYWCCKIDWLNFLCWCLLFYTTNITSRWFLILFEIKIWLFRNKTTTCSISTNKHLIKKHSWSRLLFCHKQFKDGIIKSFLILCKNDLLKDW